MSIEVTGGSKLLCPGCKIELNADTRCPDCGWTPGAVGIWARGGIEAMTPTPPEAGMEDAERVIARAVDVCLKQHGSAANPAPQIIAALTAVGYKLLTQEPTEAMLAAGWIDKEDVNPDDIWGAMWDAAP